jgi:hypothetical protein
MPAGSDFLLQWGNREKPSSGGGKVPGGRPASGKRQRYPELEELAAWFHRALGEAGYESVLEFVRNGLFEKNAVYGVFGATRLLTLESTQSLAVALKGSTAEVTTVWIRAREARDRAAMAAEKDSRPRVESWADLPLPSLALRNLLEAQGVSMDRLPYSLLGVGEPALSTVYVRQQMRGLGSEERGERAQADADPPSAQRPAAAGATSTLSLWDALERNDHLLVTGEPGAGKSTLGHHLVRSVSKVWLREADSAEVPLSVPLVAVRIAARFLDGEGAWSTVLARAVGRSLGHSLLQEPDAGLFAGRVQGVRWLIVLDGLDEIPVPQVRAEVIRSVSQHARARSDYRFVVTTRALPEAELAPLRGTDLGSYVMRPFGRTDLEEFARKWFAAQPVPLKLGSPEQEADRFIRETSDGRLRELVQNPLLATIAAVSAVKEPTRPLPTSRVTLYERFCGYLVTEQGGRRDMVPQLRRRHQDDPARLGCMLWLYEHRSQILAAVAQDRLEGEGTPWQTAIDWVAANAPGEITLVDGWKDHLSEALTSTGLLVAYGSELRFLHQSFAEFLAARTHADTIGDEFADLDSWVRRSCAESQRAFALFTLTLWASGPGHDSGTLIGALLETRDPRRVRLAGQLMAEGVTVSAETADRVIDRLVTLARIITDSDDAVGFVETLGTLFDYPHAAERLDDLASHPALGLSLRAAAVAAFEHVHGGSRARELLLNLLPSAYGTALQTITAAALRLGPSVVDAVRGRILQMVAEEDADSADYAKAAELLLALDLPEDAATAARSVLADRYADPGELRRAGVVWLDAHGDTALPAIAALAHKRPVTDDEGRAQLAQVLLRAGERTAAAELAQGILDRDEAAGLDRETIAGGAVRSALDTLLSVQGADAVLPALAAVDRWAAPPRLRAVWQVAMMLKRVVAVDPTIAVVPRVRALLEGPGTACVIGAHDLIAAWMSAEGTSAAEEIMDLIDRGKALGPYDQAQCADTFLAAGAAPQAAELAYAALHAGSPSRRETCQAARVLVKIHGHSAMERLTTLARAFPALPTQWFAGVMDLLEVDSEPYVEKLAIEFAHSLMESTSDSKELYDAFDTLLWYDDSFKAQDIACAAWSDPRLTLGHRRALTLNLAAAGELALAKSVWQHILTWQGYSWSDDIGLVRELLVADSGAWAEETMREQLVNPATSALRRMRLRQMIAEIRLASMDSEIPVDAS